MSQASFRLEREGSRLVVYVRIEDSGLLQHAARLQLIQRGKTLRSGGHECEEVVAQIPFHIRQLEERIVLPDAAARRYTYRSDNVDIQLCVKMVVDDGVFFDTRVEQACALPMQRSGCGPDPDQLAEPSDAYSFSKNLKAIPWHNRLLALVALGLGGLVVLGNLLLGAHDQWATPERAYFYDKHSDKGEGESPMLKALAGSGGLGAVLWLLVHAQLRRYARLRLNPPPRIDRNTRVPANRLIQGRARVALENAKVRLVAYNEEFGRYTQGSGKDRKTRSFRNTIRGLCLFEQTIARLPAQVPIESVLQGEVYFDLAFDALYPPTTLGDAAGIKLQWELQLLHPDFVDHEVSADANLWVSDDFWSHLDAFSATDDRSDQPSAAS